MPRPPRHDPEDGWHHVMNRGANRQPIFFSDSDRIEFGQRLADIHERFEIEVHAYCLMDNHFHLLVRCPNAGLSAGMQVLSSLFTRHVNDRVGRDGPLFRGRFHSRTITDWAYLLAACRYIHRNPIDLGVRPDRYRWSSHRTYLGHRPSPPWLSTGTILDVFAGDRPAFDRFVRRHRDTGELIVRSSDDVALLDDAHRLVLVEAAANETEDGRSLAKTATLSVAADRSPSERHVFAEFYGLETPGAIRAACSRARRRVASSVFLQSVLVRATELIPEPSVTSVTVGV